MTHSVLIVDDEPNIVLSLEFLLQEAGYEVRVAHDGQQALDAVAQRRPDLILLDVMLPRVSGFEVCQRIREHEQWRAVRILMLSAKGREVEVAKGLALGADAYITKPFAISELLGEVARQLAAAAPKG